MQEQRGLCITLESDFSQLLVECFASNFVIILDSNLALKATGTALRIDKPDSIIFGEKQG